MSRFVSFLTLGLFFVSMLSGLIVVFAYHPSAAFASVQKINFLIPYGEFFRKLHYFSSEIFTISLLMHILLELSKSRIKITNKSWIYSILGFASVVILMFSGFVLKADLSANGAAEVAFNLIKNTPVLNSFLSLFKDNTVFYYKFFIWHILFLPLMLGYAIYRHIDTLYVKTEYLSIAFGITVLAIVSLNMPSDINLNEKATTLSSPWFFQGAENMLLKSLSPLSVNLILFIPFAFLFLYIFTSYRLLIKTLLILWLLFYAYISVFGL
ncbi:MAG: cytochrome b N-terminal domain-containing protein [Sulfurospirillum sp.]